MLFKTTDTVIHLGRRKGVIVMKDTSHGHSNGYLVAFKISNSYGESYGWSHPSLQSHERDNIINIGLNPTEYTYWYSQPSSLEIYKK